MSLEGSLARIREQFGAGGSGPALSTGSLRLDRALGTGGWPAGEIALLAGDEGSGKSTIALASLAACRRAGQAAVLLDLEGGFEVERARALGLDPADAQLIVIQPPASDAAACFELLSPLIASGAVGLTVIDSVAAMGADSGSALLSEHEQARRRRRQLDDGFAQLAGLLGRSGSRLLLVDQLRFKPGADWQASCSEILGLKAAISLRIHGGDLIFRDSMAFNPDPIGAVATIQIETNRLAPLEGPVTIPLRFATGTWPAAEVFMTGREAGWIRQTAAGWLLDDQPLALHQLAAINALELRGFEPLIARCLDARPGQE